MPTTYSLPLEIYVITIYIFIHQGQHLENLLIYKDPYDTRTPGNMIGELTGASCTGNDNCYLTKNARV